MTMSFIRSSLLLFNLIYLSALLTACGGGESDSEASISIGGTVTGLDGRIVLTTNFGDQLEITTNGEFTFPTKIGDITFGNYYEVSVISASISCDVVNGSGTATESISNIEINCDSDDPTPNVTSGDKTSFFVKNNKDSINATVIANSPYGSQLNTLSSDGNIAYTFGAFQYLSVLDISTPDSPSQMYGYSPPLTAGSALLNPEDLVSSSDGNTIYVADGSHGLQIIDISTPAAISYITYGTTGSAHSVTLSSDDNTLYVVDGYGLKIIDTSTPGSPSLIATYDMLDVSTQALTLSSDGSTAYIADFERVSLISEPAVFETNFHIFDVSTSTSPSLIATYNTTGLLEDIAVSSFSNTAYIAKGDFGMDIIDISTPSSPILISTYSATADEITLSSDGDTAFILSHTDLSLRILDVSTPSLPSLIGTYVFSDYPRELSLSPDGNMAYVSVDDGLYVIDVSVRSKALVATLDTPSYAVQNTLSPDGNTAYVADGYSGLQVIDISAPSSPSIISNYDTTYATGVSLSPDGNIAFVADALGLKLIDVSSSSSLSLIGSYGTSGTTSGVALSPDGNTAYIADQQNGVLIIDVSIPSFPSLISSYNTLGSAWSLTLSSDGNIAYVADNQAGLQIIDISIPVSPSLIASYATADDAYGVKLSSDGKTAYVAARYAGLEIIDISTPSAPTPIGWYTHGGLHAWQVTISSDGNTAFVAGHLDGLQVINISNPASPSLITTYDTSGHAYDVTLSADDSIAYIADYTDGLQIIDLSISSQFEVVDFITDTLNLSINNSAQATLGLNISTDRNDVITIGSYDSELSENEYTGVNIDIPLYSISGATGSTEITLTLSDGSESFVNTVYYTVY